MVHNSCYRILAAAVNQSTGRANCLAAGGRLALVSTAEEMSALQAYMQQQGVIEMLWVDGTDAVTEGVWLTDSGDVMSYMGFTVNEPNGGVEENCIVIFKTDIAFHVTDVPCDYSNVYSFCEF